MPIMSGVGCNCQPNCLWASEHKIYINHPNTLIVHRCRHTLNQFEQVGCLTALIFGKKLWRRIISFLTVLSLAIYDTFCIIAQYLFFKE